MVKEAEKTKIVEIIADSEIGGGPKHVLGLLKNLDRDKFRLFLICPEGNLSTEAKKIAGVHIVNIPFRSKFDWQGMLKLRSELERIQALDDPFAPMVVHSHGARAGLFSLEAARAGMVKIYTEHRYDQDFHLKNPINEFIQKQMLKKVYSKSSIVVAVSSSVKNFVLNNGCNHQKVVLIPNAIDPLESNAKIESPKKIKEANKAPVIGTIGNLNTQKGQKFLIQAMARIVKKFPLSTLEIVGDGPEYKALKTQVKSLKLSRSVTFLGQQKDVYKFMKHWDVFALPSIAETFGIVLLEAASADIPIVAAKVGGIVDFIEKGKTGLLVQSSDPQALASAVLEILEHPALAAKLKRGAKEKLKEFYWEKVIKKFEALYLNFS